MMTAKLLYDAHPGVVISRAMFDARTSSSFVRVKTYRHKPTLTQIHTQRDRIALDRIDINEGHTSSL